MAIPSKPNLKTNFTGNYPEQLPQLPDKFVSQFPELRNWQDQVNRFWLDFRLALARERDELLNRIDS